jgi:zinc/manganese transport system substrate-binding protein
VRSRSRRLPAAFAVALAAAALAACAETADVSATGAAGRSSIVVSYSVLGSLVRELVGDAANVTVLMPNGIDPHDWQPSAEDVETVSNADLVVVNGLHLEEGLDDVLEEAERGGIPVFTATEHVDLRTIGGDEVSDEHGGLDPHIWTDPTAMKEVVSALTKRVETDLGIDVAARASDLVGRLDALDAEIEEILSSIPESHRKLVTAHESMGYFADRYGFELVGALVPGGSSQAESSAADLAELKQQIAAEGVEAIFTEAGESGGAADAIADEIGVAVVELPSHSLPEDGSYFTFVRGIATSVADALTG